jgi:hypothetical protein
VTAADASTHPRSPVTWALRVLVAAGLVVDAVVHLRLAGEYQFAFPDGIGGGKLFRLEAAVALVAAAVALLWGRRPAYWLAFMVAASAFVAVLAARYVELPAVGPLPSMYEPVWFFEKTLSAVAEAVAALASLVLLVMSSTPRSAEAGSGQGKHALRTHP